MFGSLILFVAVQLSECAAQDLGRWMWEGHRIWAGGCGKGAGLVQDEPVSGETTLEEGARECGDGARQAANQLPPGDAPAANRDKGSMAGPRRR